MVNQEEIEMFIGEAESHVQNAERIILNFEDNPKNKKSLDELNYTFQALKALAPMVGFNNLSMYCLYYESIVETAKDPNKNMSSINEFIEIICESLEFLHSVINRVKEGDMKDVDPITLNDQKSTLDNFKSEYKITFIKPIEIEEIDTISDDKKNKFYKIHIQISETCKFKRVRLFFIFRALNNIGHICWSNPNPTILENADFEFDFEIFFISHSKSEEIEWILDEILEIDIRIIKDINPKEFKKIITDYCLKWQKSKEKMEKLKETFDELEREYEINFIYPISTEEFDLMSKDKSNIFYYLYVRINLSSKNKKARLYFILKALNEIDHICWSNPNPRLLENAMFNLDFELYVVSKKYPDVIYQSLEKILEIDRKIVKELKKNEFKKVITKKGSKEQKKIQKVLDGLDERLALGEISEETYSRLYKKWKSKLI